MNLRRVLAVTTALALFAAACSLAVDTVGLTGGGPLGPADAQPGSDARTDGPAPDGSVVDGGADAPAVGPDASFCQKNPGHTFCADFEEGTVDNGWSSQILNRGGTVSVGAGFGSSRGLLALAPSAANGSTSGRLLKDVGDVPKSARVEFDTVFCPPPPAGAYYENAKLELALPTDSPGGGDTGCSIYQIGEGVNLTCFGAVGPDGGPFEGSFTLAASVPKRWVRVAFEVDLSTTVGRMRGWFDGALVVDQALATLGFGAKTARVLIGVYSDLAPACSAQFDSLLVDVTR